MCLLKAFSGLVKSEAFICLGSVVIAANLAAKSFLKLLSVLRIIQLKAAVTEPSIISLYVLKDKANSGMGAPEGSFQLHSGSEGEDTGRRVGEERGSEWDIAQSAVAAG